MTKFAPRDEITLFLIVKIFFDKFRGHFIGNGRNTIMFSIMLLRIRSTHLEILGFPMGGAYLNRDTFARFKTMRRKSTLVAPTQSFLGGLVLPPPHTSPLRTTAWEASTLGIQKENLGKPCIFQR